MSLELGTVFRRTFHLVSPVFLVYYLLPEDLWVGFPKPFLAFILWSATLAIETLRLVFEVDIIGIREYERGQISAYFWGGTALVLGLILFPPPLVVVSMFGMAWVDPICAWSRERVGYPLVPLLVYALIAFSGLWFLTDFPLGDLLILSLFATGVAIAAEYPTMTYVDDDFTMLMVPLLGTTFIAWLL
ncbi:MAG: hypothetical protein V3U52_00500 [Thermoplasmata archaeon]